MVHAHCYFNGTIDRSGVVALDNGIIDRCREMDVKVNRQVIFRVGAFADDVDKASMSNILGDIEIVDIGSL